MWKVADMLVADAVAETEKRVKAETAEEVKKVKAETAEKVKKIKAETEKRVKAETENKLNKERNALVKTMLLNNEPIEKIILYSGLTREEIEDLRDAL